MIAPRADTGIANQPDPNSSTGCYDPKHPVVCLDETSRQLIGEVRAPLPPAPGQVARYDGEYVRNGTANLFMAFEPLAGWRQLRVTERRGGFWNEAQRVKRSGFGRLCQAP
jgi:hypothetical protein